MKVLFEPLAIILLLVNKLGFSRQDIKVRHKEVKTPNRFIFLYKLSTLGQHMHEVVIVLKYSTAELKQCARGLEAEASEASKQKAIAPITALRPSAIPPSNKGGQSETFAYSRGGATRRRGAWEYYDIRLTLTFRV